MNSAAHQPARTRKPARYYIGSFAKVAISVALLWILFATYDFDGALVRLAAMDLKWLAAALLIYALCIVISTIRWRAILEALKTRIAFYPAFAIVMIGLFFNQVLPSNLGGDAMRIWRLQSTLGPGLGRAVGSVMLDRIIALTALALLVASTLPSATRFIDDPKIFTAFGILIAGVVAGLAGLLWLDRVILLVRRVLPVRIIDALSMLALDSRSVLLNKRYGPGILFLALLNQVLVVLLMMALAKGLAIQATFIEFLVLVPPVLLASVLPLSFAGWGVREGAMIALFSTIGVAPSEALALSVAFGLVALVGAMPGGIVWLLTGNRSRA